MIAILLPQAAAGRKPHLVAIGGRFRTLATEALAARVHNPGLHPGRADVIVAGVCILVRIMRYFDFDECLVSESDLLDGLALSLLEDQKPSG